MNLIAIVKIMTFEATSDRLLLFFYLFCDDIFPALTRNFAFARFSVMFLLSTGGSKQCFGLLIAPYKSAVKNSHNNVQAILKRRRNHQVITSKSTLLKRSGIFGRGMVLFAFLVQGFALLQNWEKCGTFHLLMFHVEISLTFSYIFGKQNSMNKVQLKGLRIAVLI